MITQTELKEILHYNPLTGEFHWRKNIRRVAKGQIAGTVICRHYTSGLHHRAIGIRGKTYYAHRLAWLYMTGAFPVKGIDHRDRNGLNNIWLNLREATQSVNMLNSSIRYTRKGKCKGVSFRKDTGKWRTRLNDVTVYHGTDLLEACCRSFA